MSRDGNGLRNATVVEEAELDGDNDNDNAIPMALRRVFKKNITGDVFGTSDNASNAFTDSLAYRARMLPKEDMDWRPAAVRGKETRKGSLAMSQIEDDEDATHLVDSDSDNEYSALKQMNPKQQLALTIKNWADNPANDEMLKTEGIISALNALVYCEDPSIRRCCAVAYYRLSARPQNHKDMLEGGVTTAVVTLTMQARSWKVAKLCAMTLCYLSMHPGGEETMANEGAILALALLLNMKGHKLLPVSVQALYNLTCAASDFSGLDRVIKVIL
jgi:hypothetical protein